MKRRNSSPSAGEVEHVGHHHHGDVLAIALGGVDDRFAGRKALLDVGDQGAASLPGDRLPGLAAFGEKNFSRMLRAIWWNGGSLVIGGAYPIGAGMSGRNSVTTTPWLEKCSGSY